MTWTAPGAWFGNSNANVTETNQAVGNLLIVEVINFSNSTVWATGLTGGGATWVQAGVKFSGTTNAFSAAIFLGKVTSTGSVTIAPTWSGTAPASWGIAGREFHSSIGSWTFDKQGNLDVSGGNLNWVSLTPTFGAGELYFGYAANATTAAIGSTSGYVYNASVDTVNNGGAYNLNCPNSATFPVWGAADGGENFGIMILVAETPLVPSTEALLPQPPGWFPGSDIVTTQPDGIPFYAQPQPTVPPPAPIIGNTPDPAPFLTPLFPPGWFPGADRVTTEPDGIPFLQQPQPADPSQAILPPPAPDGIGVPDYYPLPPGYFPGSQTVTVDPGGIPFYAQPVPLLPPPAPAPVPFVTGLAGTGYQQYFIDTLGNPRMLLLEQAWMLPTNAGRWNGGNWQSDMDTYFHVRAKQGYNAWYGIAWNNIHIDSGALSGGRTWDGIYPLLVNGTPGAIATGAESIALNDPFWQRIDYLFKTARGQGITCFLNISQSYDISSVGAVWHAATNSQGTAFGNALATRYPVSSYPNVQWFFGDDDDGPNDSFYQAILTGMKNAGDTRTLISDEQFTNTNCHIEFDNGTAFGGTFGVPNSTYNWVYSYDATYFGVEDSYTEGGTFPQIPPVYGDGIYYGDISGGAEPADRVIRNFVWWALSSGVRGICSTSGPSDIGAGTVWQWQSGAVNALTNDPNGNGTWTTQVVGSIRAFIEGLTDWYKLIPDTGSKFITAGRGTRGTCDAPGGVFNTRAGNTYVAGSITPNGTLAIVYCKSAMSITIDQTKLGPGYTATWVDPKSLATQAATTGSTYNSTPLGNNSGGDPDWVLVFQGPAVPEEHLILRTVQNLQMRPRMRRSNIVSPYGATTLPPPPTPPTALHNQRRPGQRDGTGSPAIRGSTAGWTAGISQPPIPPTAVEKVIRRDVRPPKSIAAAPVHPTPEPSVPPQAIRNTRRPNKIPRSTAAWTQGISQPPIIPQALRDVRRFFRIPRSEPTPPGPTTTPTPPAVPIPSSQRANPRKLRLPDKGSSIFPTQGGISQPPIPPQGLRDTRKPPRIPRSVATWTQGISQPPIPPSAIRNVRRFFRIPRSEISPPPPSTIITPAVPLPSSQHANPRKLRLPDKGSAIFPTQGGVSQPPNNPASVRDTRRPKLPVRGSSPTVPPPSTVIPPAVPIPSSQHAFRRLVKLPPKGSKAAPLAGGLTQPPIPPQAPRPIRHIPWRRVSGLVIPPVPPKPAVPLPHSHSIPRRVFFWLLKRTTFRHADAPLVPPTIGGTVIAADFLIQTVGAYDRLAPGTVGAFDWQIDSGLASNVVEGTVLATDKLANTVGAYDWNF